MTGNIPKSRRGGAYLMVLTATMLMLILVAIALTVTAVSRRLTSFYAYNAGLYDLAVSGNEQVLFLLRQELDSRSDAAKLRALIQIVGEGTIIFFDDGFRLAESYGPAFRTAFINEAMQELNSIIGNIIPHTVQQETHTWRFLPWDLDLAVETEYSDMRSLYRARTIFRPSASDRFLVRTNIRKIVDDVAGFPTEVEASIIWSNTGYREIALDAYTIFILESIGVYFVGVPAPGSILFLDEFTLTMVESWRSDISQRRDPWAN
ncbi:MAG: hypothetical protein FWC73_09005 [Defluviitaleaceae bacterium]|nr:hypothetical protein [Defluviitaleaceae bacterium]